MQKQNTLKMYVHLRPSSSLIGARKSGNSPNPNAYSATPAEMFCSLVPSSACIDGAEMGNAEDEYAGVSTSQGQRGRPARFALTSHEREEDGDERDARLARAVEVERVVGAVGRELDPDHALERRVLVTILGGELAIVAPVREVGDERAERRVCARLLLVAHGVGRWRVEREGCGRGLVAERGAWGR